MVNGLSDRDDYEESDDSSASDVSSDDYEESDDSSASDVSSDDESPLSMNIEYLLVEI